MPPLFTCHLFQDLQWPDKIPPKIGVFMNPVRILACQIDNCITYRCEQGDSQFVPCEPNFNPKCHCDFVQSLLLQCNPGAEGLLTCEEFVCELPNISNVLDSMKYYYCVAGGVAFIGLCIFKMMQRYRDDTEMKHRKQA
jgi:hypothetical protein